LKFTSYKAPFTSTEAFLNLLNFIGVSIMNIFIGNLSKETTMQELQDKFTQFGTVDSCKIIKDVISGESKGFGFVEMPDNNKGITAVNGLNNVELNGRTITVTEARPKNTNRGFSGSSRY
jgi:RNA recognition motif-containing protein